MGGPRTNQNVVSEERKQKMRENYHQNKDRSNRAKIIRELERNKRYFVKPETVAKYDWTPEQLEIINKYNQRYKDEVTVPRRVVKPPEPIVVREKEPELPPPRTMTDRTYTKGMAVDFLESRKESRNVKDSTVKGQIDKIDRLLKWFGVKTIDLMEIYDTYGVKEITAKILTERK